MNIELVQGDRHRFLDMLLMADEQENMIEKYISRGDMFALYDGGLVTVAIVTDEGNGTVEIKNIATRESSRNQGYGQKIIAHICQHYKGRYRAIIVGTGDSPSVIPFYTKCGFVKDHVVKNFFVDNYDHPIIDNGVQMIDMVYLRKELG